MRYITSDLIESASFFLDVWQCKNNIQFEEKFMTDQYFNSKYRTILNKNTYFAKKLKAVYLNVNTGKISNDDFQKLKELAEECIKMYKKAFDSVEKEATNIKKHNNEIACLAGAFIFHDSEIDSLVIENDNAVSMRISVYSKECIYHIKFKCINSYNTENLCGCVGLEIIYTELLKIIGGYEFNFYVYDRRNLKYIEFGFQFETAEISIQSMELD